MRNQSVMRCQPPETVRRLPAITSHQVQGLFKAFSEESASHVGSDCHHIDLFQNRGVWWLMVFEVYGGIEKYEKKSKVIWLAVSIQQPKK